MGIGSSNVDDMVSRRAADTARGKTAYTYSTTVLNDSTGTLGLHPALAPGWGGLRVSADVPGEAPKTRMTFAFDVTGSNIQNALVYQAKAPQMLDRLTNRGWVPGNLDIQIAAVGDAETDTYPVQLSQFEVDGNMIDRWLDTLILERRGGNNDQESYALLFWVLANQNRLQGWEYGQKGNLYVLFDEDIRLTVPLRHLTKLYNVRGEAEQQVGGVEITPSMMRRTLDAGLVLPDDDVMTDDIIADLLSKYNVCAIVSGMTGYYNDQRIQDHWRSYFGEQNVIKLPDPNNIVDLVSSLMGSSQGVDFDTIKSELISSRLDTKSIDMITTAVGLYSSANTPTTGGSIGSSGRARGASSV